MSIAGKKHGSGLQKTPRLLPNVKPSVPIARMPQPFEVGVVALFTARRRNRLCRQAHVSCPMFFVIFHWSLVNSKIRSRSTPSHVTKE